MRHYWQNVLQVGNIAPTETTTPIVTGVLTSVTNPAPTLVGQGTPLKQRSDKIQLVYSVIAPAGTVTFRVWHFLPSCGWYMDDALGAAGTVTAADTDDQRALIIEYPGERVYIEVTNAAVCTLTVWAFESVNK